MTRQREIERSAAEAALRDGAAGGDTEGPSLAQTLIALHRSERAPRSVLTGVRVRLASEDARAVDGSWARWLEGFMAQIAGWPLAAAVVVLLMSLVTWQRQQAEAARRATAELGAAELSVTGTVVPGSLELQLYGDEDGGGYCQGHFRLAPEGAPHAAPVRVRWTRCDLPDALAEEAQRLFTPVVGSPLLSVRVRGHWARANEFEALGLRVQP